MALHFNFQSESLQALLHAGGSVQVCSESSSALPVAGKQGPRCTNTQFCNPRIVERPGRASCSPSMGWEERQPPLFLLFKQQLSSSKQQSRASGRKALSPAHCPLQKDVRREGTRGKPAAPSGRVAWLCRAPLPGTLDFKRQSLANPSQPARN
uniref:Uncharacterized protein n=1 Tax=Sphaerodactylus townsendi TaxID=933632 RepID=A0ACB8FXD4_9SAUR